MARLPQLVWLSTLLALLLLSAAARAALPPEEYDRLRQTAPIVVGGVVEHDPGGQARIRVEHVTRGQVMQGQIVTVLYPLMNGPQPPGGLVYYQRFAPGTRIMVWGAGLPTIQSVAGGIDVVSRPRTAPSRGGCAGCSVASADPRGAWSIAALALLLLWRRRSR